MPMWTTRGIEMRESARLVLGKVQVQATAAEGIQLLHAQADGQATALAQLCPGGGQHALDGVDRRRVGKRERSRKRRSGGRRERRLGDRDGDRIRDLCLALSGTRRSASGRQAEQPRDEGPAPILFA